MKTIITFIALIISINALSQKYTILERGWEKPPVFTDTITKAHTKNGGFPVFTEDLDSLLVFVKPFTNINKLGATRTYLNNEDFKTENLFFSISNIAHAYGDMYNVDITSNIERGVYKMTLTNENMNLRTSKSLIRSFYKYIKKAIEIRDNIKK